MEVVSDLNELISRSGKTLKAELSFVADVLGPLYNTIKVLQKDSGGILDVLHEINMYDSHLDTPLPPLQTDLRLKANWDCCARGDLPTETKEAMRRLSAHAAPKVQELFKACCEVCV